MVDPGQSNEPLFKGQLNHEQDTILRILKAAECCFYGYGFNETSMQKIADVAEVSKGLLHYHFQSKEHLFLELQINLYNRLAQRVQKVIFEHDTARDNGLRVLDELFHVFSDSDDLPIQLEIWQRALSNPALKAHVTRFRLFVRELLVNLLDDIIGPAADRLPFSTKTAADLIWTVYAGLKVLSGFEEDPEYIETVFEDFKKIVANALEPVS